MSEPLYRIEETVTTGWEVIDEHLTKAQAAEKLQKIIDDGQNPNLIRAVRENP
jgi:hypothetical protein